MIAIIVQYCKLFESIESLKYDFPHSGGENFAEFQRYKVHKRHQNSDLKLISCWNEIH